VQITRATAAHGKVSRITAELKSGAGVVPTRGHVRWVVTECRWQRDDWLAATKLVTVRPAWTALRGFVITPFANSGSIPSENISVCTPMCAAVSESRKYRVWDRTVLSRVSVAVA
jgi:hypothetical protein